jgi:hypothetical protein
VGDVRLLSLSGVKYNDLNGNHVRDVNPDTGAFLEAGIPGWTVFLDANTNGILDPGERSTTTDTEGSYTFDNLMPGSYTVAEVQRDGWRQTTPLAPVAVGSMNISTSGSQLAMQSLGFG